MSSAFDNKHKILLSTKNISMRFGGVVALDNVSIDVRQGELLAICGENGAGKSTLMKILCGLVSGYQGEIVLDGRPQQFAGVKEAEAVGISIIHQELNLVEELSIAANIFLGRELRTAGFLRIGEMNRRAGELMRRLNDQISPRELAGNLRVGDQQLVEIARAIGIGSRILIMDEPTSALTESESARLDRIIHELRASGVTMLYISHKMEEIFRLADRIAVLRDGRLVDIVDRSATSPREIAHKMVGREIPPNSARTARSRARIAHSPRLTVNGLSRRWTGRNGKWRLRDVRLEVFPGEIVGLAGLMGSGRTELFESLFGLADDEITGGETTLDGIAFRFSDPATALRAGVAMVTEDRKRLGLFSNLNVGGNISLNSLVDDRYMGPLISSSSERKRIDQQIESMGIRCDGSKAAIGSLSGGNQQKCVIARSLLTEPKLLLLDDPTRGIDIGAKAEIYSLMHRWADKGMAILMASSELPELLHVCDRIVVLNSGRIVAEFSAAEATEEKIMEAAALGNGTTPA